jgi:hypothetical protein
MTIRHKNFWSRVSQLIRNNIEIFIAKNWRHEVRAFASSEKDFRRLTPLLDSELVEQYTYRLPSEKELKVVFRGFFVEMEVKDI